MGVSQEMNKRILRKIKYDYSDSDSDSDSDNDCPAPSLDVPRGYLEVYVWPELRRFVIPISYLSHPLFTILRNKRREAFGPDYEWTHGYHLPCEVETFKFLLQFMNNHPEHHTKDNSGFAAFGSQTIEERRMRQNLQTGNL